MAFVVVRHGSEPPLLLREFWLSAIEDLDLIIFVDRQRDGMLPRIDIRIDIEPDHVAQFADELRVGTEPDLAVAVWLELVRFPNAPHRAGADATHLRDQVSGTVGGLGRRFGLRQCDYAFDHLVAQWRNALGARLVAQKPADALAHEALLPTSGAGLGRFGLPHASQGNLNTESFVRQRPLVGGNVWRRGLFFEISNSFIR